MNRRLISRAALGTLAVTAAAALFASPAHATAWADPTPTPAPSAGAVNAARAVAACDPHGASAADATVAGRLNTTLKAKMRGYMSAYRVSCARMVIKAVHDRGLNPRAAVIAIATTIVESSIDNISVELDHDSLGLFQQRASWGSREQRLDPTWATNAFLNKMISKYPGNAWMTAPIGEVCQKVQVSAYPDRYQPQAGDAQIIVNTIWPLISAPSTPVEGRLYREPDGTIAVIAGGAPVRFAGMAELEAAGYGDTAWTGVPAGWLNNLPQEPRDGTYLRSPANGSIYVTAGGAKYHLSPTDWEALGKPGSINVPVRVIDSYKAVPEDGTYLRRATDGAVFLVAGGAGYHLDPAQWEALGKPASTNVPGGFIDTLSDSPAPGTYLRNPADGAIFVTVGGAKYHVNPAEYEALGSPPATNAPMAWISSFGSIPADGSYLRNVADGAIHVVEAGKKRHLSLDEWTALGRPASTNVPAGFLNLIPDA
ncbi:hypothetical protein ACTMTI_22290 [Nonomuraea sp. H19]|uniref:hypothetical protein n=1 Tax=Nonomuraea sp. H19 TaxID=3452206 RepID=UPI003F8C0CD8